jgi:hypothetical protein
VRADRHDERRQVDEQRRAHRLGVDQAPEDQQELEREQQPRRNAGAQGAVAREQRDAARARPQQHEQRRSERAQPRLHARRDAGVGDLDRDLAHPPRDAEQHHGRGGAAIEPVPRR